MATLNQRLQDPGYKAWIKTGLCLIYAKAGIEDFADQRSKTFHQAVLNKLRNSGNASCNGVCNHATIRGGKVSCCNNCQGFVDEIDQQNQKSFRFHQCNWDNSDIQLWPNDPWEMAKVFMNQGQKATQRSPVDTDLSGILNFIDHCAVAKRCIVNTYNIPKVRDARNKVMHSASMTLSQPELSDFTGAIVDLLEDPGVLGQSTSAQEALENIRDVIGSDFDISKDNETKVLIQRTNVLQQKMQLLERDVQSNSESLKELESMGDRNAVKLQEEIRLLQETKLVIHNDIQILKGHIETCEDIKEEMRLHLKTLDLSLEGIRRVLEKNTVTITAMNAKFEALETQNTILIKRQTTLEQKESHISDQLHELRKLSTKTDLATAERHFQETLIKEYKDIGFEVPLSPIYDELNDELLKVNIDALYTDLVIIKPEKKEEIRLKSYKDIFRREGRANKTIFLKGEAGVGKSTWCIQLLYAWVKTHEKDFEKAADQKTYSSNLSNDKMRDIEEALSKFDYLFFVPLRCMKGKTIIKDVLFSPLLERLSSLERTVSNVIENCSDKVLILLDGIDEYTEDLSYKGLNQCTVITTTRPWKYDHICATNPRLKVDIVLELKGLDESGITQLAKRVCKAFMESEDSDKSASLPRVSVIVDHVAAFIEHAKHSDLTDTLKVPLTLIILLETYLEQGSFSNSKTSCLVNLLEVLIQRGEQKMLQSDLESSILRKCKDNESQEHNIALFAENEIVSDYTSLLQKLSKLAFNGLSNSCKEEALVFSEKQLGQIFTKDELQLCLKFGLLSRSRYVTSMLSKMKQTVSFYHKLVQEFFAAAWIVSNTEAAEEFKNGITSVDAILEIENVFIFVCGIDAHIGSELSKHFVEVCKSDSISDLTFVNAVFYLNSVFLDKVYELQWSENAITMSRLMLRGQKEVGFSEKPHEPLYVLDMLIFYQMIPQNEDTLIKLVRSSTSCLRRFCLGPECNIFSHNGLRKLIRILEEAVELQEMEMTFQLSTPMDCSLHDDHIQNMCIDFSRHSRLHTVTLRGNLDEHSRVWPCTLFLSALRFLPNLKELRLDGLDEGLCDILVKVIPCLKNLECLTISHDSIFRQSEKTKHQPSCNTGWERFFHSSQTKNLREFHLLNLDTGLAEIDLSQATHLELILIANVKICPVESVKQRESVETNHQSPNKAGWERFFHYLPTKNLHRLLLSNLDIGPAEIDLSQATRLREISINNVKLCPEDGAKQSQPLNNTGWERFFQSLPTKNLLYLRLCNLDIGPAEIDLSQASHLGLFIDNVKLCPKDSARQIASEKTNLPNNTGWERFFNSLPTKTLWQLKLYNLDIGTAIIQIDTNNFLYRISLVDVIMSRKAFDILHSSLKSLSKLELLDIKRVQVNGDIINMNLDNIRK